MSDAILTAAVALGATLPAGVIGWAMGWAVERITPSSGARSIGWSGAMGLTLASAGAVPLLQRAQVVAAPRVAGGAPPALSHLPIVAPAWTFPVGPAAEVMIAGVVLGAAVSLGVLAVRLVRLSRLRRRAHPAPATLTALVDSRCPVRVSTEATTAMLVGLRRPTILLPQALVEAMPPEALSWICAHELAHLRRGDHLWALVDRLVSAVFWFNPPLAAIVRRRADVRETACDALALSGANPVQRRRYAETLVQALRLSGGSGGGDALQPAFIRRKGPGHAMRLKSILHPAGKPTRTTIALTAGLVTLGSLSAAAASAALAHELAPADRLLVGEHHSSITITSDTVETHGGKGVRQGSVRFGGGTATYKGSPTIQISSDEADFLIKVDGRAKHDGFNVASIPPTTIERIEVASKGSPEAKAQGGSPNQTVVNIITKPRVTLNGDTPPVGFNPKTILSNQLDHATVTFTPGKDPKISSVDFATKSR